MRRGVNVCMVRDLRPARWCNGPFRSATVGWLGFRLQVSQPLAAQRVNPGVEPFRPLRQRKAETALYERASSFPRSAPRHSAATPLTMRASRASRASASLDARGEAGVLVASSLFSSAEAGFCYTGIIVKRITCHKYCWQSRSSVAARHCSPREVATKDLQGQSSTLIQIL